MPLHKLRMTRSVPRWLVIVAAIAIGYLLLYGAFLHSFRSARNDDTRHTLVLAYLAGPLFSSETLPFLDVREQAHMTDVKRLFDIAWLLSLISIGVLLGMFAGFFRQRAHLEELFARAFWGTGLLLTLCITLFGLAALLDFQKLWILVHVFLFPQGNWTFPTDSTLITLYPGSFFQNIVLTWTILVLICSVVLALLGVFIDSMRLHHEMFSKAHKRKGK